MRRVGQRGMTLVEMLLVVTIVSLLAGLTFPSVSSGLDSLKMRSAADSVATLLTAAITKVDRTQEPVEITAYKAEGRFEMRGMRPGLQREVQLPDGISVLNIFPELPMDPAVARSIVLTPGATFPALGIELGNKRGQRRLIRIDPLAAVPIIEIPREPDPEEK